MVRRRGGHLNTGQVRHKILIVDDDPDLISRMTQLLEDEYDVQATSDWSELSRLVLDTEWSLILMDVHLPTIKGDKLVEILRKSGAPAATLTKIHYFSSDDDDTLARLVRETGAAGFIPKNMLATQLLQRIKQLVG